MYTSEMRNNDVLIIKKLDSLLKNELYEITDLSNIENQKVLYSHCLKLGMSQLLKEFDEFEFSDRTFFDKFTNH